MVWLCGPPCRHTPGQTIDPSFPAAGQDQILEILSESVFIVCTPAILSHACHVRHVIPPWHLRIATHPALCLLGIHKYASHSMPGVDNITWEDQLHYSHVCQGCRRSGPHLQSGEDREVDPVLQVVHDVLALLVLTLHALAEEDHGAPGAAQRLVCRGGHHVRVVEG